MSITNSILTRRTTPQRNTSGLSRAGTTVLSFVGLVLVWALAAFVISDPLILPSPVDVSIVAVGLLGAGAGSMWPDIGASLWRVLMGWVIGVAVGILIGVLLASSKFVNAAMEPLLQAGRAIPPLAFSPLLVVWLGIGETSKVALIVLTVLPVMAITTAAAIHGSDRAFVRAAQTLGASRLGLLKTVTVPAVLPEIITAMRITYGLGWGSLIAAELIASTEGLGYRILQAGRYLDTATVFVGIVVIAILALLGDGILKWVYRRAVPWKGKS